jgi:sugar-specific transcriptional regulator TrmB
MNKIDLETLTFTQMTKILGIFNKMLESGVIQVDLDKSIGYLNVDAATAYLEQQIKDLKEKNKKLELELEQREIETIHRSNDLEEALEEIKRYINNFDVFKEFSFPLMKKWEEKEVQSSIDYEFKTSIQKNILDITNKVLQIVKEE